MNSALDVTDTLVDPDAVVREFVRRINAHDPVAIAALCTADHRLIDSLGAVLTGQPQLLDAWSRYFRLFPTYRIEVESLASSGSLVLLAGSASAALGSPAPREPLRAWRIPAAWRAEVAGDLINLWQVYADNKPVYELLARDA